MRASIAIPAILALASSVNGWIMALYDTDTSSGISNYVSDVQAFHDSR